MLCRETMLTLHPSCIHMYTPSVPQAWCEVNLDRFHRFHQWGCLKCIGHGLSVLCVKWPLYWYVFHLVVLYYYSLFTWVLMHDKNKINQRLWASGVLWSLGFVLGLPPRSGFWKKKVQVTMKHIHSMPCRESMSTFHPSCIHVYTPSVPQAWCEANLDRLQLFHRWGCLKCTGHGLSVLCVRWPLYWYVFHLVVLYCCYWRALNLGVIMIGLRHMSHIRPRSVPRLPLAGRRGHTFRTDHLLAARDSSVPMPVPGPVR